MIGSVCALLTIVPDLLSLEGLTLLKIRGEPPLVMTEREQHIMLADRVVH